MWIWICGPYAGEGAGPAQRAANLEALNRAGLRVLALGHVPIIGANLALPLIAAQGGDDTAHDLRLPLSLALTERCDACLRLGGASAGSDREVARFEARGRKVFRSLDEIPPAG